MRRICLTAALIALVSTAVFPAAAWVRIESPNFVVFGEAADARTREYAAEGEAGGRRRILRRRRQPRRHHGCRAPQLSARRTGPRPLRTAPPNDVMYLTWTPGPGAFDGIVVAVEFLER